MTQKATSLVPKNLHLDSVVMNYKDKRVGYQGARMSLRGI